MSHPFGDLLRQYRARKASLSQTRLAELAGYDQAILTRMSQGKKDLTGPSGRERVVRLIGALRDEGVLTTVDEANGLLKAATMSPLFDGQPQESALMTTLRQELHAPPASAPIPPPQPAWVHYAAPAPLTAIVGRQQEVAEVAKLLGTARLVTVTGAGGSGKTRLAIEVAGQVTDRFTHGVCFVGLAPVRDAISIIPAIARALDIPEQALTSTASALSQFLSNKSLLLVLDNYEHVLDAAHVATDLLAAAPGLKVLATSREPLRLSGEHVFPLEPLAPAAALDLFMQRAYAAKPSFVLDGQEPRAVELCARLDHLPLAIELAAARVRQFTLAELLKSLSERKGLQVLTQAPRDAPARHRTLRDAIAWSYTLLDDAEQHLLRTMGAFAGGTEWEEIKRTFMQLCSAKPADANKPALSPSTLYSLVEKSLVRVNEQADGTPRYSLIELIREFALDEATTRGELDVLCRAHAEAFCLLAEAAEPHVHGNEQAYWVQRLVREHDNIRAALEWSLTSSGDPQFGLRLASHMWQFWGIGTIVEGSRWLCKVLDATGTQAPAYLRGRALLGYGSLLFNIEGREKIQEVLEEALRLLRGVNDDEGVAYTLYLLGAYSPDDVRVLELLREGISPERWQGNRLGLEWAAFVYANSLFYRSYYQPDYEQHVTVIERFMQNAVERGDMQSLALASFNMCHHALFQGDLVRARMLAEQALGAARAIGACWEESTTLVRLAEILELMGDLDQSEHCLEQWFALSEKYGWPDEYKIQVPDILGKLARDRGDYVTAQAHFASAIRARTGTRLWWSLEGLSCVATALGQSERAACLLGAAEMYREKRNNLWWEKDKRDFAPYQARTRAALGDTAYAAAYARGRAMTDEQAIAYALQVARS